MIKIFPANSRHTKDHGWLKSNFSFSFADYYDPNNISFGSLRVLNDDIVAPGRGFGAHPHKDMEIVSIVLFGHLKHEDNSGHQATTSFGGVQRMTAGTGIVHSEMNPSQDKEVSFLQLWFTPEQTGLTPSYEQTTFDINLMENQLLPIVQKESNSKQIAKIHQDVTIYFSDLKSGKEIHYSLEKDRKTFIFVLEGNLTINEDTLLSQRDSARMSEVYKIHLKTESGTRFMLIDLV